jgi:hypothetical protein
MAANLADNFTKITGGRTPVMRRVSPHRKPWANQLAGRIRLTHALASQHKKTGRMMEKVGRHYPVEMT